MTAIEIMESFDRHEFPDTEYGLCVVMNRMVCKGDQSWRVALQDLDSGEYCFESRIFPWTRTKAAMKSVTEIMPV